MQYLKELQYRFDRCNLSNVEMKNGNGYRALSIADTEVRVRVSYFAVRINKANGDLSFSS